MESTNPISIASAPAYTSYNPRVLSPDQPTEEVGENGNRQIFIQGYPFLISVGTISKLRFLWFSSAYPGN